MEVISPAELQEILGIDGTWIDPKLLDDGRREEMEYVRNTVRSKLSMRRSATTKVAIFSR